MPSVHVFLQYYLPHVSGLTNMAADIAQAAAKDGWDVHVHAAAKEGPGQVRTEGGVTVHTYPVTVRLGRASLSLGLLRATWRLRRTQGIAHFHLPYPESGWFAWVLGRGWRKVVTYQCDAPTIGLSGRLIAFVLDRSHRMLIARSDVVVTSSSDYADHSRLQDAFEAIGARAIPATSLDRAGGSPVFAQPGRRHIGFLGRPTSEKGIDVLLAAMDELPEDVVLLLAGPLEGLSEPVSYDRQRLEDLILAGRAISLGFLSDEQLRDFYASLDVFVLPSTNSFEAFGIVQVEAMSAGVPAVTSSLPGVRSIPHATGLGEVTRAADPHDLAAGIQRALSATYDRATAREVLESRYLSPVPEQAYLEIYRHLADGF